MDRLAQEAAFHNRQAEKRAATFLDEPQQLQFEDDAYLDHETWIRPAMDQLGDVRGLRALDFGCGHGMAAVVLARRGAKVTAFDLSWGYLSEARKRAIANSVTVHFVQADGERLPFDDASFDRIWGNAILHHLNLQTTATELFRILAPGGVAVFAEPWGENPILNWARSRIAYPGKQRTPDERPIDRRETQFLRSVFPQVQVKGYQFLSMARRVLRHGPWLKSLDWWDHMLLSRIPRLQQYCRYVVLTLHR
jgi:ubiquinone/menaquinone biosynthesis C-methylase UbiE